MPAVLGTRIGWTSHLWIWTSYLWNLSLCWSLLVSELCQGPSVTRCLWCLTKVWSMPGLPRVSQWVCLSFLPSKPIFTTLDSVLKQSISTSQQCLNRMKRRKGHRLDRHTSPVFSLRWQEERKQTKHYFSWWGEGVISCSWFIAVMWRQWQSFIHLTALSLTHRSCQHTSPGKVQLPGSSLAHH